MATAAYGTPDYVGEAPIGDDEHPLPNQTKVYVKGTRWHEPDGRPDLQGTIVQYLEDWMYAVEWPFIDGVVMEAAGDLEHVE